MNWGGEGAQEQGEEALAEVEQEGTSLATTSWLQKYQLILLYGDGDAEMLGPTCQRQQSQGRASSWGQPMALLSGYDCGEGVWCV